MKALLNVSEGEIILLTITGHPPHITHYLLMFSTDTPDELLHRVRVFFTKIDPCHTF